MRLRKVAPKAAAVLSCTVRGLPRPRTAWLLSGVELDPASSPKYRVEALPAGVEGEEGERVSLRVEGVGREDAEKLYTCRAWNEVGEDQTSAKIALEGRPAPPSWILLFYYFVYWTIYARSGRLNKAVV